MTQEKKIERSLLVQLVNPQKVNEPWLENQAIRIEEALDERCSDVLGPSVTANFAENGFDLDLTIVAASAADVLDKLGEVYRIVEEIAGIELGGETDEVRSAYESTPPNHDLSPLQPAC